jgi:hypothetical protein
MIALSSSVHLFARPETKARWLQFASDVLGLSPVEVTSAYLKSPQPMYTVTFANGAGMSIEFAEDALSDDQALRGAWFELRADDPEAMQHKALAFGLRRVVHPATPFFYTQAPGGQVFRIVGDQAG